MDSEVTLDEVKSQISMLELLFDQSADMDEAGRQNKKYMSSKEMLSGLKTAVPTLFDLLDSDSNKKLTKKELAFVTKFEKSLKKDGGMRDLLREIFSALDVDGDDKLSVDELFDASKSDDIIADITVRFHKLFPLRDNATELESFVKKTIESLGGKESLDIESVRKGMKWIDDDEDGYISRKEVGIYYNIAGKQFMDVSKSIKVMGPMMAMFNNMGGAGGNAGRAEGFKMDL